MTQDFAKKPRSSSRNSSRNNARSSSRGNGGRGNSRKQAPKSQVPGWVWLFTGTVLGAFIMFLVYLSDLPQQTETPSTTQTEQTPENTQLPKPRFDFYQLLKESEVPVHRTKDIEQVQAAKATEEYLLQVGSFKKNTDADRLRAELILLNLDAQVETVTVRSGETWHRVVVGPYLSHSKMAAARSVLISNEISPLLLKRKVKG